jgi:ubiquinol-cytochrome c reductase subunit 7
MFGPLGPTLAPQIRRSRTLYAWLRPIAKWYIDVSGYRKMGLTYDDLRARPLSLHATSS